MILLTKSGGEKLQPILDEAKSSNREEAYRSGEVFRTLKSDFHRKCYICEDDEITAINVEHFEPHKGDLNKKYDWNNFFLSCGHCNNLKSQHFWPLLNCTVEEDKIWESIEIRFVPFPKHTVKVVFHPQPGKETECENTRKLLYQSLSGEGCTPIKKEEARSLRKKMNRVFADIYKAIRKEDFDTVKQMVADDAPFAGMLRWLLKKHHPGLFMMITSN
jgi:hypothetical protein